MNKTSHWYYVLDILAVARDKGKKDDTKIEQNILVGECVTCVICLHQCQIRANVRTLWWSHGWRHTVLTHRRRDTLCQPFKLLMHYTSKFISLKTYLKKKVKTNRQVLYKIIIYFKTKKIL